MNRKIVKTIALETFVLVVVLSAPWQTRAQDTKAPYPITFKRTELVLAGLSKAQISDGIKIFVKKELPPLEPGGMTYMMSSQAYLGDDVGHWAPHLMFYLPLTDGMTWGADVPGSPVLLNPQFHGAPEPISVFMIPVSKWSDGTARTDTH